MIEDLEFAMEIDQEEINRLKDRDRKREKLLADKAEAKRLAVEKVRQTEKDKWEAKRNEHWEQLEDKLSHHKKEIDSEYKNIFEEQRKSVNVAHAEKRAAWKLTAQANRKAKRLAVEVDDLKTVNESESEASEDESMGENSDSQEDSPCQPMKLGFEVRPRRELAGGARRSGRGRGRAWRGLRRRAGRGDARGAAPPRRRGRRPRRAARTRRARPRRRHGAARRVRAVRPSTHSCTIRRGR